MKKELLATVFIIVFNIFLFNAFGQNYTNSDFVGTWNGTISATNFGGYNDPITMTIHEDGFYTETSGHLMPTNYPNTQQFEYQGSTNRLHWWYLQTVYSGQYFYNHFYYEIVHFENDTLVVHYNFWDNPEPTPAAGIIFLVKENASTSPPPFNLNIFEQDNMFYVEWDSPENGTVSPEGFNVYVSIEMADFELLGYTEGTQFMISENAAAGLHEYYVTAVYESGESDPSESLYVFYATPEPLNLQGEPQSGEIMLDWTAPTFGEMPTAEFYGYNLYHKFENGTFELVQFTEDLAFIHENPETGMHNYYVTAVYNGGESEPSNEIEVSYVISSLDDLSTATTKIYPNPAVYSLNIETINEPKQIKLFNIKGQQVKAFTAISNAITIDVSHLDAGVYMILIETESKILYEKFIKK